MPKTYTVVEGSFSNSSYDLSSVTVSFNRFGFEELCWRVLQKKEFNVDWQDCFLLVAIIIFTTPPVACAFYTSLLITELNW